MPFVSALPVATRPLLGVQNRQPARPHRLRDLWDEAAVQSLVLLGDRMSAHTEQHMSARSAQASAGKRVPDVFQIK